MSERMSDERLQLFTEGETPVSDLHDGLSLLDEVIDALVAERAKVRELEAEVARLRQVHMDSITIAALLNARVEAAEAALREISLCSQNSMSSKEECGRIARVALQEPEHE